MLTPTLGELIDLGAEEALARCFTALTGKVVAYDATTRTADVQPLTQRSIARDDGSILLEDLPVLPSVVVVFPMSGPFSITFPIEVGSVGLLLVLSDNDAQWRTAGAGTPTDPGDLRRFHLSCARFLPGYQPDAVAHPAAATAALVVKGDPTLLGDETATDFVALASKIADNFTDIKADLTAIASAAGSSSSWLPSSVAATKVKAT